MRTTILKALDAVPVELYDSMEEEVEILSKEIAELKAENVRLKRNLDAGWNKSVFRFPEAVQMAIKIAQEEVESAKLKRRCEATVDTEGIVTFRWFPAWDATRR